MQGQQETSSLQVGERDVSGGSCIGASAAVNKFFEACTAVIVTEAVVAIPIIVVVWVLCDVIPKDIFYVLERERPWR